jgi:hypothetical protein
VKMPTLCFLDAFHAFKSGSIEWDKYIRHLLIHLMGVKHEDDRRSQTFWELQRIDPFGYGIWCWNQDRDGQVLSEQTSPFIDVDRITISADVKLFEELFQSYHRGDVEETRDRLAATNGKHADKMRKCITLLALQDRQPGMLEMCFERDFAYEYSIVEEADRVEKSKDPATFQVLENSRLREHFPRLTGPLISVGLGAFDRGGTLPVPW